MPRSEFHKFLRIYYERGSGNAVIDNGPGTTRVEIKNLVMRGRFTTDHSPHPPKFWLVASNAVVTIGTDVAWIDAE
jgi:hypothetical protein